MRLADDFNAAERELPPDWAELQLELLVTDPEAVDRAAALLAPANPGRLGTRIRFTVARRGAGIAPEAARRLLRRLDEAGVAGKLELLGTQTAPAQELRRKEQLRTQWERALQRLPADWSDLYGEVRLDSTDYLERAALHLSPLNPARHGDRASLRFRCAHHFGYGVSPEMAARCFERCDEEGITGSVEVLRVLSDTNPVATQGPVWLVGGRVV